MTYPYLPYAITEAYCAVFAITIWVRLNNNLGSEHEVRQLRNMIYSYLGMLSTDIIWALSEDNLIHFNHYLYASINAATVISVACGCYFWFRFIEDRLRISFASDRKINTLLRVPLLVICALDAASIFTGWFFFIDAQGHYQSTSLFWFHTAVDYFYLLIPTVYSVYRARRTPSRQDRAEYMTYALYMIAPLLAGLLEDVFPRVPLLALNIFMMILILFLMIQNKQIYNDALTGLNNRGRLTNYMEEALAKASPDHPLLLFVMDINNFKSINDHYGHLEGDNALRIFADVLREVASKYYAFIARYGGDEFCVVMYAANHDPEEIVEVIHQKLKNKRIEIKGVNDSYLVTVSIGYTICDKTDKEPNAAFERADSHLYENKRKWHMNND